MDFVTAFGNINWWAVALSVGLVLAFGFLWYSNIFFGRAWVYAVGKTKVDLQQGRSTRWLSVATIFWLMCVVLTIALVQQFMGIVSAYDGFTLGLILGFGIAISISTIHYLFENRLNSLLWINAVFSLFICVIPSVILAWWR